MIPRLASAVAGCLLASAPAARVAGFAPRPPGACAPRGPALSPLPAAAHAAEDAYPGLLDRAARCAGTESCSVDSARGYLREIVRAQSGCAAGTLSGAEACGDVQGVSAVVADLRQKIAAGATREARTFWGQRQEELETLAAAADGSAALTAPLKPAFLAVAALYTLVVVAALQPAVMDPSAGGTVPLSPQEAWWAVRDGYLFDAAHHLFRNGGLLLADPAPAVEGGLAPQELWWAVRDGYAGDALFARGGGGAEAAPFTPQEVWWSLRQGYAADLARHWYRNGGL